MPGEKLLETVSVANPNSVDEDKADEDMIQRIQKELSGVYETSFGALLCETFLRFHCEILHFFAPTIAQLIQGKLIS